MARCIRTLRASRNFPSFVMILLAIFVVIFIWTWSRRLEEENIQDDFESRQRIDLVVVACEGKKKRVLHEAITMIKSVVTFSGEYLQVHIFTDTMQTDFKLEFSRWPKKFKRRIKIDFREVEYPLSPDETAEFRNWWGPCASFRLFLPQILNDVDSVIYVDTDVIFLAPIEDLWDHFSAFSINHVGALAPRVGWNFKVPSSNPNFITKPDGKLTQVNSGVFLMNLTRMREKRFSSVPKVSNKRHAWDRDFLLPLYHKHKKDMHGDQNLINIIFHYNPKLLYLLPCKFNYHHKFCFDDSKERLCESAELDGAAIIHGSANTFYNQYSPAFAAINNAFRQYNFEEDLESYLIRPMTTNLMDPSVEKHEHCGGRTELFTRQLEKSVAMLGRRA